MARLKDVSALPGWVAFSSAGWAPWTSFSSYLSPAWGTRCRLFKDQVKMQSLISSLSCTVTKLSFATLSLYKFRTLVTVQIAPNVFYLSAFHCNEQICSEF